MLVAAVILALYFWAYFADVQNIGSSLLVSDVSAIAAATAFVLGYLSYLFAPRKYIFQSALTVYYILCITTAVLVLSTGGTISPFIALWMIVSIFAAVFGLYGVVPLFLALGVYLLFLLSGQTLDKQDIVAIVLAGELPLALGFIIWHTKAKTEDSGDKAYRELASELSQVAGKSEVVINAIADGVIAIDNKGVIQLINPAAQQIIGWGKQDALALDYKSVLKMVDGAGTELTATTDPISQALTTNEKNTTTKYSLLTSSGKKILVSIVVSPVGQIGAGVIVVFRDITKEKAEEREQAEFISTASHEMRTPVASIEGYLGLALNPSIVQMDDKGRDYIAKAHESVKHLGRLFQDLLDVTKADDGRLGNNPKVVDVVAFAHDIVQGLRLQADAKGLRLFYKPQPDDDNEKVSERRINPVYYANVDNDHLREVISNLVENAIKYTPKGDVVIDVNGDSDHVTISVADSGIGIPKEDQVHLFQKFYRVDNTDTREIGGTGLGLYLSRRLAETMDGRIWVESEYKQGSTFNLEIPRIDHEDAMRMIESAASQPEPVIEVEPTQEILIEHEPETVATPPVEPVYVAPTVIPVEHIEEVAPLPIIEPEVRTPEPVYIPEPLPVTAPEPPPVVRQAEYRPRPNTSLASIEQNPGQYTRRRAEGVAIPARGPQDQA